MFYKNNAYNVGEWDKSIILHYMLYQVCTLPYTWPESKIKLGMYKDYEDELGFGE